jgi:murein L,D-transpeptidase YcbB/YkuD
MKPTGNATTHPASSCKTSTEKTKNHTLRQFLHFSIRFWTMTGLLMLSTSYQSHKMELVLLEEESYIPAFADHMDKFFRACSFEGNTDKTCVRPRTMQLVKEFYFIRQYTPAWTVATTENNEARELLDLLTNAERFGLNARLFPVQEIRRELDRMKEKAFGPDYLTSRMNAELMLSDACFQFMIFLNKGYRDFDSALYSIPTVSGLPNDLMQILASHDFEKDILSFQPDLLEYQTLQKALELFLATTRRNDEQIYIPDPSEDSVSFRKAAQDVLIRLGYLLNGSTNSEFISALKKFQYYHGLEPDGIPGRKTCQALAQTTEDKFRQIALNLDRIRKENIQSGQYIAVNIPAYRLKIIKGNHIIGNSKVIVGSVKTPTPLISSKIERIITNPDWQVPRSITLREMLPKLKSDSDYLRRNRLRLMDGNQNQISYQQVNWNSISTETFDYKIRQDAGRDNALGRVKFIFPSPYSVYLHDTPGKQSFSREDRALSHGCVRVQDPGMLADYLVSEFSPQYHGPDLSGLMEKGIRREIVLEQPADLYIHYLTCEADEDHHIFFYPDVYGLDEKELKNLEFLR